jgi:flagellar P-ring protein precursor FlgI
VNFTKQSLGNMMEKMNIHIDKNQLNVKNVAGVMVTANIPACFSVPPNHIPLG